MFKIESNRPTFDIQVGDETVYHLPTFSSLPARKLRERIKDINTGDESSYDKALDLAYEIFDEYAPGLSDMLSIGDLNRLVKAYMTFDEDEPQAGESSTSSD